MHSDLSIFNWIPQQPATPLLTQISELRRPGEVPAEPVARLKNAVPLLVNYAMIQQDFPHLSEASLMRADRALARLPEAERKQAIRETIDHWLIRSAAFISLAQASQTVVNEEIPTGDQVTAYRPPGYGRSFVCTLKGNSRWPFGKAIGRGLLDVKGAGVAPGKIPSHKHHRNGLFELEGALYEVLFQQLIESAFRHGGGNFATVPIYGVIDPKIEIKLRDGSKDVAGIVVRRAHARQISTLGFPSSDLEEDLMMEVELYLRRYGISSVSDPTTYTMWPMGGHHFAINHMRLVPSSMSPAQLRDAQQFLGFRNAPVTVEGINVQLTRELNTTAPKATLVDFTHYTVFEKFEHTVYSNKEKRFLYRGNRVIAPGDPEYVQPDPALAVPFEQWGSLSPFNESKGGTKRASSYCSELANDYSAGKITRQTLEQRLNDYLAPVRAGWGKQTAVQGQKA